MGSSSSKFKKYLQHGDEYAAMQVYQSSPELRRDLDPNCSYGEHHAHNTALHYASRHGMKHLIRAFLNDLDGDPNRRDDRPTEQGRRRPRPNRLSLFISICRLILCSF